MLLTVQIAAGILLAVFVLVLLWLIYKGIRWLKFKYDCWQYEEDFVNGLAAQIRAERENKAKQEDSRQG